MTLGQYLNRNGMSYSDLAREIGVTKVAVGSWVRGEKYPSRENMQAIRRATFGAVTADDFLDLPPRRRLKSPPPPADPGPERQAAAA